VSFKPQNVAQACLSRSASTGWEESLTKCRSFYGT
jgi:hypothetical protein